MIINLCNRPDFVQIFHTNCIISQEIMSPLQTLCQKQPVTNLPIHISYNRKNKPALGRGRREVIVIKEHNRIFDRAIGLLSENEGMKRLFIGVLCLVLGFLSANARVYSSYAPFGISLCAALPFFGVIPSFIGSAVGYVVFSGSSAGFRYIASMAAVVAIRWTLSDLKRIKSHPLFPAAICSVPVFATGLAILSVGGFSLRLLLMYGLEALLGGAGAYFISRTVIILSGTKSLGMLTPQELASLIMTSCILLLALVPYGIEPLSLGRACAVAAILFFARYGGVAGGAASGTAAGAVLSLYSENSAFLGAAYAFGGLIAGLFAPVGRAAELAGFITAGAVMSLQLGDPALVVAVAYETIGVGVIFIILPPETGAFLRAVFVPDDENANAEGLRRSIIMRLDFASKALSGVKDDVEDVSERLSGLVTPTLDGAYEDAVKNTCSRCGMRVFCWEHSDGVSMDSFDYVTDKLRKEGSIAPEDFRDDFRKKCCRTGEMAAAVNKSYDAYIAGEAAERRIEEVRRVVAGQFCGLSDILSEMAQEYSDYEMFDTELSDRITAKLKELGIKPTEVSCRIDRLGRMTIEAEAADTDRKKISRALLVHELSKLCGRRFDSPTITSSLGSCRITLCELACLDAEVASSQHISGGGRLCGDSLRYFTDGTGRLTAIISDGMGTGGRAAVDGGMASGIMEKLLKAGLGCDCSLKVVNSALLVKSGDESLATLDVVNIDLYDGGVTFLKAGAALSFIRKGGDMYRVETPSLPAGILPDIGFSRTEDKLSSGDIIVMLSDGAIATGEDWIERMISSWGDRPMKELCDVIIDEACSRRTDGKDDDITVLAMLLK